VTSPSLERLQAEHPSWIDNPVPLAYVDALESAITTLDAENVALNEHRRPDGCKCDFRTYMLGDGCDICNPAKALEYAREEIQELTERLAEKEGL
jgi:hypothetical protein